MDSSSIQEVIDILRDRSRVLRPMERQKYLAGLMRDLPFLLEPIPRDDDWLGGKPAERLFFRGRRGLHDTVRHLWAPPPDLTLTGRANLKHKPALYCADEWHVCLAEVVDKKKDQDEITTLVFKMIRHVQIVPIGVRDRYRETLHARLASDLSEASQAKNKTISDFLDEEFRQDSGIETADYLNSSIYAHLVLHGDEHSWGISEAAGLRYSPIDPPEPKWGKNYAFDPARLDGSYALIGVQQNRVKWGGDLVSVINTRPGTIQADGNTIVYDAEWGPPRHADEAGAND